MDEIVDGSNTTTVRPVLGTLQEGRGPIVLERKSKKKRRKSKGLEDAQDLEAAVSRALRRAARAGAKGTSEYDRARRRSARKKRDGAIRDFVPNMGEALSEGLREASAIPADVADSLDTKATRRRVRRRTRDVSEALRTWRL